MKKRNWIFKIASALMMACLLTTCVISGTFAKFTSQASGSTTVKVATWDFNFEDSQSTQKTFAVDLAATTELDGGADEQVDTTNEGILAPGTKGSFSISLENKSQVSASYAVSFEYEDASKAPTNLKFCATENGTYSTLADLNGAFAAVEEENRTLAHTNGTDTITVYWKWEFTNTDETSYAGNEIVINATIDLTQVD